MSPAKKTWLILFGVTASEAVPLVLYTAQAPAHFARYLGFTGAHRGTFLGWTLALLCAALFTWNSARRSPAILGNFFKISPMKLFAVLLFAPATGIFEEMYFRKALMDVLAHGGGALLQLLLSALIFGVAHGIWGLFGKSLRIAIGATVATSALGAMLAVVYLAAARSAAPCIVSHTLINICLEPWLILAATSRSWRGMPSEPVGSAA